MERQLKAMEVRLARRESELLSAVEESRAAAKMERIRLQAMHAQVILFYQFIII